ncbi:MAG: hypothetical protein WDO73_04055 [Ignavibacteriota bacterium]
MAIAIPNGTQAAELIPGSALLWNLATWNQRGDDLAGVNAIAVVGNAGQYTSPTASVLNNASDGLVSTTSAAIGFVSGNANATQTRVVPYCHVDPGAFATSAYGAFNCNAAGIANVSSASHLTGQIVRSFLKGGDTAWQSIGTAASSDTWLKSYGGEFFALQNVTAAYANDLTTVSWSSIPLNPGGNLGDHLLYRFRKGHRPILRHQYVVGHIQLWLPRAAGRIFQRFSMQTQLGHLVPSGSTNCAGAVTPLSTTAAGRAVTSGDTLTLTGVAFGSQCSNCRVYATPAGKTTPTALQVTAWNNTSISAVLPSSLTGYQTLQVEWSRRRRCHRRAGDRIVVLADSLPRHFDLEFRVYFRRRSSSAQAVQHFQ